MWQVFKIFNLVVGFIFYQVSPSFSDVTDLNASVLADRVPDDISADGAFHYTVPIDIPSFRDIQPLLSLTYSSQNRNHFGDGTFLALGWNLRGLSSINRKSVGGGIPQYEDLSDVYVLDDQELLACKDSGATNKWRGVYPGKYVTNTMSASCASGGNFSTLTESYQKIVKDGSTFYVYNQSGVRRTYKSVGQLEGRTGGAEDDQILSKRRWLLSEIRDTQASPNIVTFKYEFAPRNDFYADRIKEIEYGNGYRVVFDYENKKNMDKSTGYAVGHSQRNLKHNKNLTKISVWDQKALIRKYEIKYKLTYSTQTPLVESVQQYGSKGEALKPWTFSYNGDQVNFKRYSYALDKSNFYDAVQAADFDRDGRDDILMSGLSYYNRKEEDWLRRAPYRYSVLGNKSIQRFSDISNYDSNVLDEYLIGVTGFSKDKSLYFIFKDFIKNKLSFQKFKKNNKMYSKAPASTYDFFGKCASSEYNKRSLLTIIGQFDLDDEVELIFGNRVYDFIDGNVVEIDTIDFSQIPAGATFPSIDSNGCISVGNFSDEGSSFYSGLDFDGDGLTEVFLFSNGLYVIDVIDGKATISKSNQRTEITNLLTRKKYDEIPGFLKTKERGIYFVDVNGDGADDIVTAIGGIRVALSNGITFDNFRNWDSKINDIPHRFFRQAVFADINSDNLIDIIVPSGDLEAITYNNSIRYPATKGDARLYISTGREFVQPKVQSSGKPVPFQFVPNFLTVGDFDGNGLPDVFSRDAYGKGPSIMYNNSNLPFLMIGVDEPQGQSVEISYKSTFRNPGYAQLVDGITYKNGNDLARSYKYNYYRAKYDYDLRRFIGYGHIQVVAPAPHGEAELIHINRYYDTSHYGMKGKLIKEEVSARLKTKSWLVYSKKELSWQGLSYKNATQLQVSLSPSEMRPYRVDLTSEISRIRYGNKALDFTETRTDYVRNLYGQLKLVKEYGFNGTQDDKTTGYIYFENLSKYIVNKPSRKIISTGLGLNWKNSKDYVSSEYYSYDDQPWWQSPTRGNMTYVNVGLLDGRRDSRRHTGSYTYDKYGNVVVETNARWHKTKYQYDAYRHLFRTHTTNAVGHTTRATWDQRCQAPVKLTDANGVYTRIDYDQFCREVKRIEGAVDSRYYGAKITDTRYAFIGNPKKQYVEVLSTTASSDNDKKQRVKREYFDGSGQVYKIEQNGGTSDLRKGTVVHMRFDELGNITSQSIPLSWGSQANGGERNSFFYDALGRLVRTSKPDAGWETTSFALRRFRSDSGQVASWPTQIMSNEDCHVSTKNVPCLMLVQSFNADGQLIWSSYDGTGGNTHYKYDSLGQLTGIRDAMNHKWEYQYDVFGNRISVKDPALGSSRMRYDSNGNLVSHTDAGNQTTRYWYDSLDRVALKRVGHGPKRIDTGYKYDEKKAGHYNIGKLTSELVWTNIKGSKYLHRVYSSYHKNGLPNEVVHNIDGKEYLLQTSYKHTGDIESKRLPYISGSANTAWLPQFKYDASNRLISFGPYIKGVNYNNRSQPTKIMFGNGAEDRFWYNTKRGWIDHIQTFGPNNRFYDETKYWRAKSGRVSGQKTHYVETRYSYKYDRAGRLVKAENFSGRPDYTQTFHYNAGGYMTWNSRVGRYERTNNSYAPTKAGKHQLSYDKNGNMTRGYDGKVIEYDAANRPIYVKRPGKPETRYVYGAGGTRLKKIERDDRGQETVTVYFDQVEIRNFGQGSKEKIILYPHESVRLEAGESTQAGQKTAWTPMYMHHDQLGSTRTMTNKDGKRAQIAVYRPFGEQQTWTQDPTLTAEDKGYIGERFDADAGLQYLNARYYDPKLALFTQPDWFDPTEAGVGTNRYTYSANDPVNRLDPNGNNFVDPLIEAVSDLFRSPQQRQNANAERYNRALTSYNTLQSNYNQGRVNEHYYQYHNDVLEGRLERYMEYMGRGTAQIVGNVIAGAADIASFGTKSTVGDLSSGVSKMVGRNGVKQVVNEAIPGNARRTLKYIRKTGKSPNGYKGGGPFDNDGRKGGQILPRKGNNGRSITYKEYDVNPQKKGVNRGTHRIVIGSDGRAYYTSNHYDTFTKMK